MTDKNKLTQLSLQQVYEQIDDYGTLSLGNATIGIPKDSQFIAKILEPVDEKFVEQLDKNVYSFKVEMKENGFEPIQFKVRVSESAVKRMTDKHSEEEYVGKRAFFSKASWKGKLVHHVNIILKESSFEGKPELKKLEPAVQAVVDSVNKGESLVKDAPEDKVPEVPEELKDWAKTVMDSIDDFKEAFCDTATLQGKNQPLEFIKWVKDAEACGTDYISSIESEEEQTAKAASLYWALVRLAGL